MSPAVRTSDLSALTPFFSPASVAIIGATDREGSVGRTIARNLLAGSYKGKVYAVNPRRTELFGQRCYASIGAVPEAVDLVVVVTPANTVPGVVADCVKANARSIVVISAGFKEMGAEGAALERDVQAELRKGTAQITVRFISKLVSSTRDRNGTVIDGNAEKVTDVTDVWTFARDVTSRDPNWKVVATEAGQ